MHLVKSFAEGTILGSYSLEQAGEAKIKQWFEKLKMLRDVSQQVHKLDVAEMTEEMIKQSREKWQHQGWKWLTASQTKFQHSPLVPAL